MADNKETNQKAEHQCHECAKFLKKGCINLFPLRVKPTARACKSYSDPVIADKKYCNGRYIKQDVKNPHVAVATCPIRERCKRYIQKYIPKSIITMINAEKCANHGYPYYIRNEKK